MREKTDFLLMQVMLGLKFRQVNAVFPPKVVKKNDHRW